MYETIVLGATYLAAGIASRQKKKCLIIEQTLQAGYEFFGALNFGADYDATPKTQEGASLYQQFFSAGVTPYMRNTYIYPILKESDVLFGTQIVDIEKKDEGYLCRIFGVDGYSSVWAKKIVDTRCFEEISSAKTYNLLVESDTAPQIGGVMVESTGVDRHYVLRCPVPLSCDYGQARAVAEDVIRQFAEGQKLILLADEFDYQVKQALPEVINGISVLPSKAYKNPVCAFEAGQEEGRS